MILVDTIRKLLASGCSLENAIHQGIDICINQHVLEESLKTHRAEVTKIMTLDYTFEKQIEYEKRDSYQDGVEQGMESTIHILKDYLPTPEAIWERIHQDPNYTNVTLEEVKQYY